MMDPTAQKVVAQLLLFVLVWGISGSVNTDDFARQVSNSQTFLIVGVLCRSVLLFVPFLSCRFQHLLPPHTFSSATRLAFWLA